MHISSLLRAYGLTAALLVLGAGVAAAQTTAPAAHVGVAVRTLVPFPAGVDVAVALSPKVNLRAGFNLFTLTHDFDNDGLNIAAKLKLSEFDTHLDWYPGGGSFHISPGLLVYNNIEVNGDATVTAGTSFDLGDATLFSNPASPVTGKARVGFDRGAPSILIGWGNVLPRGTRRSSIPFEIGVIYSKAPLATLTLSGSACTASNANCRDIASDATLQNDLKTEVDKMNKDLEVLKFIPVVSLGFSIRL